MKLRRFSIPLWIWLGFSLFAYLASFPPVVRYADSSDSRAFRKAVWILYLPLIALTEVTDTRINAPEGRPGLLYIYD